MLNMLLQYALIIFFQFLLSIILFVPIGKFFEWIYSKEKARSHQISDIFKSAKFSAKIIFLTGITMLGITIVINIFFFSLIGFYLSSLFIIYLGSYAVLPTFPKGRKIFENCWVIPFQRDNFIVTLNDHKILICGEMLKRKYDHIIYKETMPKWLPPHEDDPILEKDYKLILDAVLKFLAKQRRRGVIQGSSEDAEPSLTKEDVINRYAQKGWKVEKLSDGSTKVSPPKKNNLITRIINLF